METPRAVLPTESEGARVRATLAAVGMERLREESFRDRETILRIASTQPVRGASLRSVLAACARLETSVANPSPPTAA